MRKFITAIKEQPVKFRKNTFPIIISFNFQDPIGWLIHCTQLLVSKAEHIYGEDDLDSDPDLESLPKLQEILDALTSKFADMDLNDMNIVRHLDCNRATVEGQVNFLRVESLKNCYEALMEYIATHGADKNASKSRLILQLMTKHHDLQEVSVVESSEMSMTRKCPLRGHILAPAEGLRAPELHGDNPRSQGVIPRRFKRKKIL